VEAFAAQAVIAIENAGLFSELLISVSVAKGGAGRAVV
jgi:hypothetical protein